MNIVQTLKAACEATQTVAPAFMDRAKVPTPAPETYIVIDYISGTPVRAQFDSRPCQKLLQVTVWSRKSRAAAFTTQDAISAALLDAGFRAGQDRDMSLDDGYYGCQTDWRIT